MDISLTKLPWYAQLAAFVVLACGAVGGFYWYYEKDARLEIETRVKQLETLRADIAKGQGTAVKLPQFRAQVGELENRLVTLREVLPEEKDAADLLRRMQIVAVQSNLKIKGFKPAPVVMKQLHAEWPIALELDGTYHNLAIFLDRVGKFTRIVNITDLQVHGKDKPEPNSTITATCIATTYVLLDKPAATKTSDKAGDKDASAKKAA
jgi:type IV pilus assembly protein PilO